MDKDYAINELSENFLECVRKNLSYIKCHERDCTGGDWEEIVAEGMHATRINNNAPVVDIETSENDDETSTLQNRKTSWSAKTIKVGNPFTIKHAQLISGRINLNVDNVVEFCRLNPNVAGRMILETWNKRVERSESKCSDVRTIVLLRAKDLSCVSVYEKRTEKYNPDDYIWSFKRRSCVLTCVSKITGKKMFRWQKSGAQFSIRDKVPNLKYLIRIQDNLLKVTKEKKVEILKSLGYTQGNFGKDIVRQNIQSPDECVQMELSF